MQAIIVSLTLNLNKKDAIPVIQEITEIVGELEIT